MLTFLYTNIGTADMLLVRFLKNFASAFLLLELLIFEIKNTQTITERTISAQQIIIKYLIPIRRQNKLFHKPAQTLVNRNHMINKTFKFFTFPKFTSTQIFCT